MGEVISVFEYDLLGSGKAASVGAKLVPQQVFDYLEELSLTSTQGSQFLKLTSRSGFKLLQVQNYAGCCGQLKLATALEFFQYRFSDSFGGNPPLYSCGLSAL